MFNVTKILLFIVCTIFSRMIFVLGFAVLYCVMQFVISSQSTPQNSFPYPRRLAFRTPDINHAEFGEPIWLVSVGCILVYYVQKYKKKEQPRPSFTKLDTRTKKETRNFSVVSFFALLLLNLQKIKITAVTPYLRHFRSKLIPFCSVNKIFSCKVSY